MPDDKNRKGDPNLLYLDTVYPDAWSLLSFAPKRLRDVWAEAVFVLDTNALLVPYGTDPASLDAIRTTYRNLVQQKRLLVPAHAVREFAKNRPERLKTAYDQLAKKQSLTISASEYPLLAELPAYKDLKRTEEELADKVKSYRAALRKVLDQVREWYWDDPVSALYRELFTDSVVVNLDTPDDKLADDFAFRSNHKVPPGYKDAGKEVGAAGDLVIWHTILQIGSKRHSHLVFVSGEEKSDWWYRTSEGVLYPRFELLDEYRRASDGKTFHIIQLADLLAQFGAKPEVVAAVREEEAVTAGNIDSVEAMVRDLTAAQRSVTAWLAPRGVVSTRPGYVTVQYPDGTMQSVVIGLIEDGEAPMSALRRQLLLPLYRLSKLSGHRLLVAVARDKRSAMTLARRLSRHYGRHPELLRGAALVAGYVADGEFQVSGALEETARSTVPPQSGA